MITFIETKPQSTFDYWDLVRPAIKTSFEKVSADQVFGNPNCKNVKLLRLFSQLHLFLLAIQEEREIDANNDSLHRDLGNKFYIDKYCIKSIRKALLCRGMDSKTIQRVFNLYNLIIEIDVPVGIGAMHVQEGDPLFTISLNE